MPRMRADIMTALAADGYHPVRIETGARWNRKLFRLHRAPDALGVAGISMCLTPNSESASISALATAGMAPTQPASPRP